MRVAIVGNSGSGKSTLARQIAEAYSMPALDLDTIVWEPGRIAVARPAEAAAADLAAFTSSRERWVVEGCYAGLVRASLESSPILLFVDPGLEACLANCRSRPWEPVKFASKAEQDAKLDFLLDWVHGYYTRDDDLSLTSHRALFDGYRGPKLRLAHHRATLLDDLGARFDACTIPVSEWTHAAHLVVGMWHVARYGAEEALLRLRHGIRRLNESNGGVNSATNGYHETITAAYVRLLAQYLEQRNPDDALGLRAIGMLATPLAAKDALFTFYSRDVLMSTTARAAWVEPDLLPINLTAVLDRHAAML